MLSKLLKKRNQRAGLPPGSLITLRNGSKTPTKISLIEYDPSGIIVKDQASLDECLKYLDTPSITWVNLVGINDTETISKIGSHFGMHPLMLEDIMSVGQRSKIDNYKDHLYIVAQILTFNETTQSVETEQVSVVLGKSYVISFLEEKSSVFNPIRERLLPEKSRIRQRGADYLCYALIDCLVDSYFLIFEKVDEKLETLEEELINTPNPGTPHKIQLTRREIMMLRKSVWPMREVISNFRHSDYPLIQDATKLYIQDVYDHTIQAIDTIESFRDITAGMLDIYMSSMTNRMNEVMKVLTIVSTIFIPLGFLTSLYGMNFVNMPELKYEHGYFMLWGVMILITVGMLLYFRKRKWI